jgi:hypothetical protein
MALVDFNYDIFLVLLAPIVARKISSAICMHGESNRVFIHGAAWQSVDITQNRI